MNIENELNYRMKMADLGRSCRKLVSKHLSFLKKGLIVPVDVEAIAKVLKIKLVESSGADFDGCLSWDEAGNATITVRKSSNHVRRRFTIAHELGHWMLQKEMQGKPTEPLFRGLSSTANQLTLEEKVVNRIAAEMLLPYDVLQSMLAREQLNCNLLRTISRRFNVSRLTAIRRVAEVANTPVVYLNIVPRRFRDLRSVAEVDEAVYASEATGLRFDREFTRIISESLFEDIITHKAKFVEFAGSMGRFKASFDAAFNRAPIPNADLIAVSMEPLSATAATFLRGSCVSA